MKTILKAGLTIDGISNSPLKNQAIVIENSTISKICHQDELTDEDTENSDLIENPDGVTRHLTSAISISKEDAGIRSSCHLRPQHATTMKSPSVVRRTGSRMVVEAGNGSRLTGG